jgi:hypothetical protein
LFSPEDERLAAHADLSHEEMTKPPEREADLAGQGGNQDWFIEMRSKVGNGL